jgi:hypothetical protein
LDETGKKGVTVVGFAAFFLEDTYEGSPNGQRYVVGRFIKWAATGGGGSGENYGLFTVRLIKTVIDIILSASGSNIAPHFVTKSYFLARYPSRISVSPANKNIKSAINVAFGIDEKNTIIKTGTSTSLMEVNMLGTFMLVTPL